MARITSTKRLTTKLTNPVALVALTVIIPLIIFGHSFQLQNGGGGGRRPSGNNRNRMGERLPVLKDAFYEDNSFVVRIRTTYNQSASVTCNAILMEEQLVLSDVTCIKYQGMANIDARYVHVLAGEPNNETTYGVEQIYINKADPKDPSTELALLRLDRPMKIDGPQCRSLIKPEKNQSIELETAVRIIGYTSNNELKENRTRVAKKYTGPSNKYICTTPAEANETPGSQLLRGAPLMHMVDCKQFQLVGILTKLDTIKEISPPSNKHQDCYVSVSTQIKWYDQVRILNTLAAKNDASSTQPTVIVVTVDDEPSIENSM